MITTKKFSILIFTIVIVLSSILVPILINESYKVNSGYRTLWEAKDALAYFGTIVSAIGTIFIGIIAFKQNERSNDVSDRLLKLEEINNTPFLLLDIDNCKIRCFRNREVDMLFSFKNITKGVINIIDVSAVKFHSLGRERTEIPFCKGWTTFLSVLPQDSKQINFYKESSKNDDAFIDVNNFKFKEDFIQLTCLVEIKLQYFNSQDIYNQKLEFFINMLLENEKISHLQISSIENSLEKEKEN